MHAAIDDALDVEPNDPTYKRIPGRRVTVTINGGGDVAGAGGGPTRSPSAPAARTASPTSAPPTSRPPRRSLPPARGAVATSASSSTRRARSATNMATSAPASPRSSTPSPARPVKLQVVRFSSTAIDARRGAGGRSTTTCSSSADVTELKTLVGGADTRRWAPTGRTACSACSATPTARCSRCCPTR